LQGHRQPPLEVVGAHRQKKDDRDRNPEKK
jgi:hypothetical protein